MLGYGAISLAAERFSKRIGAREKSSPSSARRSWGGGAGYSDGSYCVAPDSAPV